MGNRNELGPSHIGDNSGTEILVMKEHQVPRKPTIEREVQVLAYVASTLVQEQHTVGPK
jgi:hypothetical protein